jgi:hypothetical protein
LTERNRILDYSRVLTTEYNRLTSEGAIAAQEHQCFDPLQEHKTEIEVNRLGASHIHQERALYLQRINPDSFLFPEFSI